MITRGLGGKEVGELVSEAGALVGGAEADLGVEGEGGEAFAGAGGAEDERGKIGDDARGDGDEVGGRESVATGFWRGAEGAEGFGGDEIAGGGGADEAFGGGAAAAGVDGFDEAGGFELMEVVVDLLAGHLEEAAEAGGGVRGLLEMGEHGLAAGIEEGGGGVGIAEDLESEGHGDTVPPKNIFVNRYPFGGIATGGERC